LTRESREAIVVSELQGVARIQLHEGKLEDFRRVADQCMEIVRGQDTGTLQYEVYLSEDLSESIVLERYRDSEALMEHARHLGALNEAIVATGSVSGALLGEPSGELRALMAGGDVGVFTLYQSM
jgi:quinol monooxygenase YgiN